MCQGVFLPSKFDKRIFLMLTLFLENPPMTNEIIPPDLSKEKPHNEKPASVSELLAIAEKLYTKLQALNQLEDQHSS